MHISRQFGQSTHSLPWTGRNTLFIWKNGNASYKFYKSITIYLYASVKIHALYAKHSRTSGMKNLIMKFLHNHQHQAKAELSQTWLHVCLFVTQIVLAFFFFSFCWCCCGCCYLPFSSTKLPVFFYLFDYSVNR